jgi:hypothetical protein
MLRTVVTPSRWNWGEENNSALLSLIPTVSFALAAAGRAPVSAHAHTIGSVNLASRLTMSVVAS